MIGYKLLKADGTSLNGQFHYPLDGTWVEVPGNGAYVSDGLHEGLLSSDRPWDMCVEMECEGPTNAAAPERVRCYRRVRVRRILEEVTIMYEDGTCEYYRNGKLHREDGPAIEWCDGTREWYSNGVLHRLDGPAVERSDGFRFWYRNGLLHRLDGPAIEGPDGTREWWQDDNCYRVER